ncbi:MAG: hypothetical protein NZ900_08065 [Synergistetes bacterium]|nr:hypothetical protein [Synergistota bacterium]MDW8192873.1 hypothetical protein [Synergistota bacterium]
MELIVNIFLISGLVSICSMILATFTVLFKPWLSKRFTHKALFKIHKIAGILALLSAINHAILYYIFLR